MHLHERRQVDPEATFLFVSTWDEYTQDKNGYDYSQNGIISTVRIQVLPDRVDAEVALRSVSRRATVSKWGDSQQVSH